MKKIKFLPILLAIITLAIFITTLQLTQERIGTTKDFHLMVLFPGILGVLTVFFGIFIYYYFRPKAGLFPLLIFHFLLGNLVIVFSSIQLTYHFSYLAQIFYVFLPPVFFHFTLLVSEIFFDIKKRWIYLGTPYFVSILILFPYLYLFSTRPSLWWSFNWVIVSYFIVVYLIWIGRLYKIYKKPYLELDKITAKYFLVGQLIGFIGPLILLAAIKIGSGYPAPNYLTPLVLLFPISILLGMIPSQKRHRDTYLVQSEKRSTFGNLLAGLAHELNNPLNFISSNVEPMSENLQKLQKYFPEPITEVSNIFQKLNRMVSHMQEGIQRAESILNTFRDFPKPQTQTKEDVDLVAVMDQTIELLAHKWKNRIEIDKEFDEVPKIKGYPTEIGQIFTNLLSNAIDAISGQGVVSISVKRGAGGVKVEIQDTGIGISDEELGKIFDPFYTTKEQGEGTGLGLAIALQLVMNHHGTMQVKSKQGEGTKFIIFFPLTT